MLHNTRANPGQDVGGLNLVSESRAVRNNPKGALIATGDKILESYSGTWSKRYPSLYKDYENATNLTEKKALAATAVAMHNQREFIEGLVNHYTEATTIASLGPLAPRIIDIVRIFFPNMIAVHICDIQPISSQTSEIVTITPEYETARGGVSVGDEVFKERGTGEVFSEHSGSVSVGTGNGSVTVFTATMSPLPVRKNTLTVLVGTTVAAEDDGDGNLRQVTDGAAITVGAGSVINYATGALSVTFTSAPAASAAITAQYRWDSEETSNRTAQVTFEIATVPIVAEAHKLRTAWSVEAQYAASAKYGLDVEAILTRLGAEALKKNRDTQLVTSIQSRVSLDSNFDFDASVDSDRMTLKEKYQEFVHVLNRAEGKIYSDNSRGEVSFILCGVNAANVISQIDGYVPIPNPMPVGSFRMGQIYGKIDVIKSLEMSANEYIFGFRGMQLGDAPTILAEWIPVHVTPVFQNPNLQNQQGMLSMYKIYESNNNTYYIRGQITNYTPGN